jgi:hypothetical protein
MRIDRNCRCMRSSTSGRCVSPDLLAIVFCLAYRLLCRLKGRSVTQCIHDILESSIKGLRVIEGLVEQAICQLSAMRSDLVYRHYQAASASVEHEQNVGAV